jgi:hypothetical protein
LLLQRVYDVVQSECGRRGVDEVKIDLGLATGFERLPFGPVAKTGARRGFRHIHRFVPFLHLLELALK